MTRLAALVPTPRAGKRLVNLYRLVRIGIPEAQLGLFLGDEAGGPYQAVQVLLAMLCGCGAFAHRVFERVLAASPESPLLQVLGSSRKGDQDHGRFHQLSTDLTEVDAIAPLPVEISEYQRWCPALARYSFHTRDLVGPAPGLARPA